MRRLLGGRRQERRALDEDRALDAVPEDAPLSENDSWSEDAAWSEDSAGPDTPELADTETDSEREFQPFVPVEAGGYRSYGDDAAEGAAAEPSRRRLPRPTLPRLILPRWVRPRLGFEVRIGILLTVAVLIAAGIFGTLLVQGTLRESVEGWWPLIVIGGALLWMLVALARRQVAAFLGAWALAGVGLSALMDTQAVAPTQDTVLGIVLVAVGLGIAFRGFLLRQQAGV